MFLLEQKTAIIFFFACNKTSICGPSSTTFTDTFFPGARGRSGGHHATFTRGE